MSQGNFVWYDYAAEDVAKATAFYTETAGWKLQAWGDGGDYQLWMVGENAIGGVLKLPAEAKAMGAPPHWLSFIGADDVDAVAAKTVELGGKVLKAPWDMDNVGRVAILADNDGAMFGTVKFLKGDMEGADRGTEGNFAWNELMATDAQKSFSFYADVFGWAKDGEISMGEMGTYYLFKANGQQVGGMMDRPAEMPTSSWLYYIQTDDLDAAISRVNNNGGQIMNGPMDVPGGRVAQFVDSQGGMGAFHQTVAA